MTDLAVIMSVYKNDKLSFLKESVQSILDQTFYQFHYYIVFDGPVDINIDAYLTSLDDSRIILFKFRKDEKFYKRRSGLKYGLNYIITRFKINKSLNFPCLEGV
ncbi:MAG: hypothetical protein NTV31_07105 [Bacteroidia bacterium]|nr:hypothetical protein [Bacteroidia bacterium]